METEIEVKFCDVKPESIRAKLKKLGASLVHKEILMKRETLDFPDNRLGKIGGWARVRDEGEKITLSYKQLNDRTLHGTKEVSVDVSDFASASQVLQAVGLVVKSYQETKREKWFYNDCEVTIDTWPWVPTFVEIEGPTEEKVRKSTSDIGFDWKDALHGSVETVYQQHFDVTEEEVCQWPEIKFEPVPEEIEKKRRK